MSIIYDALKKVQEKARANEKKSAEPVSSAVDINAPVSAQALSNGSSTDISRPIMITVLITTSIIVIVIFTVLFRLAQQTMIHPEMVAAADTSTPTTQPLIVSTEVPLKLEGVMNMADKKVALINGVIYEEGQTLEDKTITAITETGVTLQADGTEEILRISP